MSFTAYTIMARAYRILQDNGGHRWTPMEMLDWINESLVEISALKPNARSEVVPLALVAGYLQELPDPYTTLARVTRNVPTGGGAGARDVITTLVSRDLIDRQIPNWTDPSVFPASTKVSYVIHDIANPRNFTVIPSNNGTGRIEAVVGLPPALVSAPEQPNDRSNPANFTGVIDLPDVFQGPVLDFTLARAFSYDAAAPNSAGRAQAHDAKARAAISTIIAGEMAMTVAGASAAAVMGG